MRLQWLVRSWVVWEACPGGGGPQWKDERSPTKVPVTGGELS